MYVLSRIRFKKTYRFEPDSPGSSICLNSLISKLFQFAVGKEFIVFAPDPAERPAPAKMTTFLEADNASRNTFLSEDIDKSVKAGLKVVISLSGR
jgi:hypothetical protein